MWKQLTHGKVFLQPQTWLTSCSPSFPAPPRSSPPSISPLLAGRCGEAGPQCWRVAAAVVDWARHPNRSLERPKATQRDVRQKKKEIQTVPSRTSCLKVFIGPMKKCDLRKGELLKIISCSSLPRIQLLPKPREKAAGRSEANPEKKAVARGGGHFWRWIMMIECWCWLSKVFHAVPHPNLTMHPCSVSEETT